MKWKERWGKFCNQVKKKTKKIINMASKIHQPAPLLCYPYGQWQTNSNVNGLKSFSFRCEHNLCLWPPRRHLQLLPHQLQEAGRGDRQKGGEHQEGGGGPGREGWGDPGQHRPGGRHRAVPQVISAIPGAFLIYFSLMLQFYHVQTGEVSQQKWASSE